GVDGSDAQAETHGRISRRSSTLAQDVLFPRISDNIIYRQKIRGIIHFADEGHFMMDGIDNFFRQYFSKMCFGPLPGEHFQFLLWRAAAGSDFFRVDVLQAVE